MTRRRICIGVVARGLALVGLWLHSLWCLGAAAPAPADTLFLVESNGNHLSETYRYLTEPFSAPPTPQHADSLWQAGRFGPGPWHRTLNLGFVHQRLWLRLVVKNTLPAPTRFLWSIYNYTDSATLYGRRPGETQFRRLAAASSRVPAAERLFPARSLSLPFTLGAGEVAELYLRIDHHAGALYMPTDVTTTEDFLAWEVTYAFDKHWVWLLGFYWGSALFNLVLFAYLRDKIHLWYVLYVGCTTLFLIMEDGLDALLLPSGPFQLLWAVGQFNFMLLATACGISIMQLFLRLRAGWPRLHRAGSWLAGLALGFVGVYTLLYPAAARTAGTGLLLLNGVRELLLAAIFAYGWVVLLALLRKRRHRRLALYYGLTYLFFFAGFSLFWLNHIGFTNLHLMQPNALAWGLFFELLVLSALLTGRFQHTLRQNAQLRIRQLRQRNAQGARLIAAQEEEREQLARELHDALGPNLAALHLAWQGKAVQQALSSSPEAAAAGRHTELLLRHLRDEVRTFSHAVLPVEPGLGSLSESVEALTELINLYGSPTVRTYCDKGLDQLPPSLQQTAYRIAAELLNNAVRHARATCVQVQLLRLPAALEILVEDDGGGFKNTKNGTGIGLRGVHARTEYLRGQVHIDSSDQGTTIVVRLPC
ncbi:sensor histidine kinase [Hymenobacter psychrotolerans]|uniref:Oxygen sensor histidine kinase NreB n=1 Tax=Hymenobacter psychrotolerans DSM 18569 TaxID=1121959 RepID=A0A1M6RLY5_9BACT|nr:7TM diverse intracellular signaling domain-containing protein [Hymenobacter psychrotolerans]SHK33439.1 Signal transduction histidine kinase [Hymenobacter psychrotolerans DSM 18569]